MTEDVYRDWKILPMFRSERFNFTLHCDLKQPRWAFLFLKKSKLVMNTLPVQKSGVYVCLVARVLYYLFLDKY